MAQDTLELSGAGPLVDLYQRPLKNLLTLAVLPADGQLDVAIELWREDGQTLALPQGVGTLNANLVVSLALAGAYSFGAILRDMSPNISTDDEVMIAAGYSEAAVWSQTVGLAVGGIMTNVGADRIYYNAGGIEEIPTGVLDGIRANCAPDLTSPRWLEIGDSLIFGRASL